MLTWMLRSSLTPLRLAGGSPCANTRTRRRRLREWKCIIYTSRSATASQRDNLQLLTCQMPTSIHYHLAGSASMAGHNNSDECHVAERQN